MAITDINSEDGLVQKTFAEHLEKVLGWESVRTHNTGPFRRNGTPGCLNGLLLPRPLGGEVGA